MSNIAVIKLAGAQHLVRAGDKLSVNRIKTANEGDEMKAEVLLSTKANDVLMNEGDVKLRLNVNKLGEKLRIVKFKAKSRYRRTQGHRQRLSVVEVISINGEKAEAKKFAKSSTKKTVVESKKAVDSKDKKPGTEKVTATKKTTAKKGSKTKKGANK
jgi:large subunit ribosomal protein L21